MRALHREKGDLMALPCEIPTCLGSARECHNADQVARTSRFAVHLEGSIIRSSELDKAASKSGVAMMCVSVTILHYFPSIVHCHYTSI